MGRALAAAGLATLCGCTTVTIQGADSVVTTREAGFTVVSASAQASPVWVSSRGYGVFFNRSGASIGYAEERTFIAPPSGACSVVVVIENDMDEERIRAHFIPVMQKVPDICFFRGVR